uniref:Putative multidomain protein n=3 Tax=Triatoma infestans TaxID=30076 RepID=A0A023F1C1_TRIIF
MAYVVWRVFMKKYTRFRLGLLSNVTTHVTPSDKNQQSKEQCDSKVNNDKGGSGINDEPSTAWEDPEDIITCTGSSNGGGDFSRANTKSLSKSKRVKSYIQKKCKDVETKVRSRSKSGGRNETTKTPSTNNNTGGSGSSAAPVATTATTSWYVSQEPADGVQDDSRTEGGTSAAAQLTVIPIGNNCCNNNTGSTIPTVVNSDPLLPNPAILPITAVELDTELQQQQQNAIKPPESVTVKEVPEKDEDNSDTASEGTLLDEIQSDVISELLQTKCQDVVGLVDRYFGPVYPDYPEVRMALVREARDLLVTGYLGDMVRFENEFCQPAALAGRELIETAEREKCGSYGPGWPLVAGRGRLATHLGGPEAGCLLSGDLHLGLCPQPTLTWRTGCAPATICRPSLTPASLLLLPPLVVGTAGNGTVVTQPQSVTMATDQDTSLSQQHYHPAQQQQQSLPQQPEDDSQLAGLLRLLVLSAERCLSRVPLAELAYPLDHCLSVQPQRVLKKDSCIQTSAMYEMDTSIPHIDSDEEHETNNKCKEYKTFVPALRLGDIAEAHLTAGIYLPGLHDLVGRAIVVIELDQTLDCGLTPPDAARVLHYLSTIPQRCERTRNGICVIVVTTYDADLDFLDVTLALASERINISSLIVFAKTGSEEMLESGKLQRSKLEYEVIKETQKLEAYLPSDQIPAACGGDVAHDQTEWAELFKELEELRERSRECGRNLVKVLSDLSAAAGGGGVGASSGGSGSNSTGNASAVPPTSSASGTVNTATNIVVGSTASATIITTGTPTVPASDTCNRLQAVQEARSLARAVTHHDLTRLRTEAPLILAGLKERAVWLPASEDVKYGIDTVERLFREVAGTAEKIEELSEKRRAKLKDIARVKALEIETEQVLSWLNHKGDDWLKRHTELATTLPALKQQEQDFEKFYFISMRHLDKGSDLLEEAVQCSSPGSNSLRDLAKSLKNHLRGFSTRLEDTRERLEDTSRCFYLLDRAYEWALEAMKYMSRVKPADDCQNPEPSVKQLRHYLMAHPQPSPEHFAEMIALATKLDNDKLLHQCKVAQCRCEETAEQIRTVLGSCDPTAGLRWGATASLPTSASDTPIGSRRKSVPCSTSSANTEEWVHHQGGSISGGGSGSRPAGVTTPTGLGPLHEEDNGNTESRSSSGISSGTIMGPPPPGLVRSNTWQYSATEEGCFYDDDKLSSSADNTTDGSDTGNKSCEDIEEADACCSKTISPIPVNSHLHSDLSVEVEGQCGTQTLKTKKTMLLIMKEMIQTERDYVRSLEYVIENYIPELVREDIPQALRGQRNVIFGNIEKIFEFHSQYFLQELERCEQSPLHVGQCFLRHEKKFYLYALYNKNKPKSDALMSEYGTVFFKTKQLELGDRMDLASYLLKPVQRMGKYALLLQQLMKAARQEVQELKDAENMVRFQLRHGNDLLAMDSLRDCDVNVKEQGRLLRQNEFLVWQGKGGKKYYRHVFLFEELILFSKARRFPDHKNLDLYIYKHSIKTSDIGLTAKVGDSNTKFEIWFRKRKPNDTFTLQSISEEIKQAWTEELSNLLWKQALKNREMRLAEMNSMGIGNKPCLDIRPSANQISDRSISIAQLSKTPRFRNSIAVSPSDQTTRNKRPHSIISVSSSSGGSSTSSGSSTAGSSNGDRRDHSQCSSAESGIVPDWNTSSSSQSSSSVDSPSPQHTTSTSSSASNISSSSSSASAIVGGANNTSSSSSGVVVTPSPNTTITSTSATNSGISTSNSSTQLSVKL